MNIVSEQTISPKFAMELSILSELVVYASSIAKVNNFIQLMFGQSK